MHKYCAGGDSPYLGRWERFHKGDWFNPTTWKGMNCSWPGRENCTPGNVKRKGPTFSRRLKAPRQGYAPKHKPWKYLCGLCALPTFSWEALSEHA